MAQLLSACLWACQFPQRYSDIIGSGMQAAGRCTHSLTLLFLVLNVVELLRSRHRIDDLLRRGGGGGGVHKQAQLSVENYHRHVRGLCETSLCMRVLQLCQCLAALLLFSQPSIMCWKTWAFLSPDKMLNGNSKLKLSGVHTAQAVFSQIV